MSKYPGRIVTDLAPAGYSVFFDGTGDYLTIANNAALQFGTGDFTFEAWVYPTNLQASKAAGEKTIIDMGNSGFFVSLWTGAVHLASWNVADLLTSSSAAVVNNTWFHVALTRSGTTVRCFVNGAIAGTATLSTNFNSSGSTFIGSSNVPSLQLQGYISNLRVIKGTALYTAAFTPPTQLFNITNTSLLTCNSPALVDQSTNNFTITANGNAAVSTLTPFTAYVPYNPALGASTPGIWTVDEAMQAAATRQWNMYDPAFNLTTLLLHGNPTTNVPTVVTDASTNNFTVTAVADARAAGLSPFSLTTYPTSGSGYLDGTGDYFTVASNAALGFGTGDFTIEFWINLPSASTTQVLFDNRNLGTGIVMFSNSGTLTVNFNNSGGTLITGGALTSNTWTHIALSRTSGSTRLFINGTQSGSTASDTNNYPTNATYIGSNFSAGQLTTGYISNVRIVKGVGVYTGNFTTPTAPLTATQAAGTNISAITGTQTSLLTLQNSQSANNNAFLDSSSNNFLITRNGNTSQGSFSPFSQTGWSNYFNGATTSGPLVFVTYSTTNFDWFTAGQDFTLECWVYPVDLATFSYSDGINTVPRMTGNNDQNGTTNYWSFGPISDGRVRLHYFNGAVVQVTSTATVVANVWNHIAFTKTSSGITFFVNGVASTTTAVSGTPQSSGTYPLTIGRGNSGSINGYVSNYRILKNVTPPYSGSYTVPTAPFTDVSGTRILTAQANRFVDASSIANTVSITGATVSIQPFSPFYPTRAYTPETIGGSGFFDGTGDSLALASNTLLNPGAGDFTIEAWVYPTNTSSTAEQTIIAYGTSSGNLRFQVNNIRDLRVLDGASVIATGSSSINLSSWNHVVVLRSGSGSNNVRLYVNGSQVAQGTSTTNFTGTANIGDEGGRTFFGYMAGLRFVKNQALASGAFTPPTSPVTTTAVGWTGANAATSITGAVNLLLGYTNAGVVDSTGDNVLETVGDARISTALSRFGGSSIAFDGTGDYLVFPANPLYAFGTGDFTVEAWVYPTSNAAVLNICGTRTSAGTVNGWNWGILTNGSSQMYSNSAIANTGASTVPLNTWTHLAFVRTGGTIYGYVNGVQRGSTANTENFTINTFWVGITGGTAEPFFGYIDELRITRFARYTGNFTPQTSQWQDQ